VKKNKKEPTHRNPPPPTLPAITRTPGGRGDSSRAEPLTDIKRPPRRHALPLDMPTPAAAARACRRAAASLWRPSLKKPSRVPTAALLEVRFSCASSTTATTALWSTRGATRSFTSTPAAAAASSSAKAAQPPPAGRAALDTPPYPLRHDVNYFANRSQVHVNQIATGPQPDPNGSACNQSGTLRAAADAQPRASLKLTERDVIAAQKSPDEYLSGRVGTFHSRHFFSPPRYFAAKTPVDDSWYGPCDSRYGPRAQSDIPRE
jgi:hypothetical protein